MSPEQAASTVLPTATVIRSLDRMVWLDIGFRVSDYRCCWSSAVNSRITEDDRCCTCWQNRRTRSGDMSSLPLRRQRRCGSCSALATAVASSLAHWHTTYTASYSTRTTSSDMVPSLSGGKRDPTHSSITQPCFCPQCVYMRARVYACVRMMHIDECGRAMVHDAH